MHAAPPGRFPLKSGAVWWVLGCIWITLCLCATCPVVWAVAKANQPGFGPGGSASPGNDGLVGLLIMLGGLALIGQLIVTLNRRLRWEAQAELIWDGVTWSLTRADQQEAEPVAPQTALNLPAFTLLRLHPQNCVARMPVCWVILRRRVAPQSWHRLQLALANPLSVSPASRSTALSAWSDQRGEA